MYDYLISNEEAIQKIINTNLPEAGLVPRYDQTIRDLVTSITTGKNFKFQLGIIEATFFDGLDDRFKTNPLYGHMANLQRKIQAKGGKLRL